MESGREKEGSKTRNAKKDFMPRVRRKTKERNRDTEEV